MKLYHKILSAVTAITVLTSFAGCASGTASTDTENKPEQSAVSNADVTSSDNETSNTSSKPAENESNDKEENYSTVIAAHGDRTENDASGTVSEETETVEQTEEQLTAPVYDPMPVQTLSPDNTTKPAETDALPTNAELIERVGANIFGGDSFVMHVKTTGKFSYDPNAVNEYTFAVTKDASYLYLTYDNVDDDIPMQTYEEFRTIFLDETKPITVRTIPDGVTKEYSWGYIANITRDGDTWFERIPRVQNRDMNAIIDEIEWINRQRGIEDIYDTAVNNIGIFCFFNPDYTYDENDTINTAPLSRNENGDIVMTLPAWRKMTISNDSVNEKLLDNMVVSLQYAESEEWEDLLRDECATYVDGDGATYIFDNNYNLKGIEADIIIDPTYNLHVSIEFSNWNNVAPIEVPEYEPLIIENDENGAMKVTENRG